jgi:hypothetical protein
MKYNEFIAALASLQKSDVNPEVITDDGSVVTGVGFDDNMVIIELEVLPWEDVVMGEEDVEIEENTEPITFEKVEFKM